MSPHDLLLAVRVCVWGGLWTPAGHVECRLVGRADGQEPQGFRPGGCQRESGASLFCFQGGLKPAALNPVGLFIYFCSFQIFRITKLQKESQAFLASSCVDLRNDMKGSAAEA